MDNSNYIVPIYKGQNFLGTGFIVGNTLITAAHVVDTPTYNYSCLWKGETINLNCANILWHEYKVGYEQGQDNHYWDLAMYNIDAIESPLELSEYDLRFSCHYRGYSYNNNNGHLQINIYNDIILNNNARYYPKGGGEPILIKKCFLSDNGKCIEGNSGGPLFQDGKVVGMLSGNQVFYDYSKDRYIKAEYIMSVFSLIKKRRNCI